jgi:hypothetical protein
MRKKLIPPKDIFTKDEVLEFADYVRDNDLRCNAILELDIKHSRDLFDIWVKEKNKQFNLNKTRQ